MNRLHKGALAALISAAVAGCAAPDYHNEHHAGRFKQYGYGFIQEDETEHVNANLVDAQVLKSYTDRIVFELSNQIDPASINQISVASFVELDDNLVNTNPLGNQLAEFLLISLREYGYRVEDLNISKKITINEQGAFVFSRDKLTKVKSNFILSGVISYAPTAININSRLLGIAESELLATNTLTIPNYIIRNSFPIVEGNNIIINGD